MIFLLDFYDISMGLLLDSSRIPLYVHDISMGLLLDFQGASLEHL